MYFNCFFNFCFVPTRFDVFSFKISRVVVGIFPAVKLPPWWAVPVIWWFRQNVTAVLHYRRKNTAIFWFYRFRQTVPPTLDTVKKYRQLSIPPKEYRQLSIPPKRYRQHCIPPKRYRRHWISPKRYRRYWIPPKRYRVRRILPKTYRLFFSCSFFVLCSLFFLVLRVLFGRTSLWT